MAIITPSWILDGVVVVFSAFFAAFLFMTRNFNHWTKKGVTEKKPIPFLGNFTACAFFKKSAIRLMEDLYFEHEGHDRVGFYIFDKPCLLVRDLNLISHILVKDFNSFPNRLISSGDHDPLGAANLFVIQTPHWKTIRTKLTPTMTSGKLKNMFQLMLDVGNDLDTHLKSLNLDGMGKAVEVHDILANYTTDVIASCAFGLTTNSLKYPDAEFRKHGRRIFRFNYKRAIEAAIFFFVPGLVKPLRCVIFEKTSSDFLRKAFWDTLTRRMKSGVRRNDLVDTLIELKNSQTQAEIDDPNSFKFDGDNLTAQATVFFTAGFETTSTTLGFTLYELALQPDIQSRLRKEIISALQENGGELHYDWVAKLPYLDMVVSESLRKYPILGFLDRVAVKDYKVPDSDLVIEKDTPVFISVNGLHHDPKYYPDPEKYDPERFNEENKRTRPSHVYLPFGEGPRSCLGIRFGLISVKLCLIRMIRRYKFTPCKDTAIPVRIDPKAIFNAFEDGLYLNVQEITTASR